MGHPPPQLSIPFLEVGESIPNTGVAQALDRIRQRREQDATLKSFKQEGCKRLNMRLKQANVMTKEGKPVEFAVDYGINLCRDGSPPTEGMDLEQIGKALGSGGVAEGYRY